MERGNNWEVIIVGGGIAGLSAAIYLGRAGRRVLVIDAGHSLARWEPEVQNFLGFPESISGSELLRRGRRQAKRFGARFDVDEIKAARRLKNLIVLRGQRKVYRAERVLLATGLRHLPPEIAGVAECLGHSMFFCKDCDGFRVHGKRVIIYGWNDETAEYALAMLHFSKSVGIVTDGHQPKWNVRHARWLKQYQVPVHTAPITKVNHCDRQVRTLTLQDGTELKLEALFTTRGDVYLNKVAKSLGAELDAEGQVVVDHCQRTKVPGLYAAGCVTPANCQMIIAAGQGAIAAQAINRDLFLQALRGNNLPVFASGKRKRIEPRR